MGWDGTSCCPRAKREEGGLPKKTRGEPKQGFGLEQKARINQAADLRYLLAPSSNFSFLIVEALSPDEDGLSGNRVALCTLCPGQG